MIRSKESGIDMRITGSRYPHEKSLSLVPAGLLILLMLQLVSCAAGAGTTKSMNFPNDIPEPFLRLEQVIDGSHASERGLLGRIAGVIFGQGDRFSLHQPTDMTVDAKGRLLIVDSEGGSVYSLSKVDGLWQFSDGVQIAGIKHPLSIASSENLLFMSDLSTGGVFILDYQFNIVKKIETTELKRPGDLCYDPVGKRLFVADPPANRVFVYDTAGTKLAEIGGEGFGRGRLQRPISVTTDTKTGRIYILDGIARKVKQYNSEFRFEASFGEYDQVPGSFAFPKGIALASDGVIFVADVAFGNVQMFDPSGALLFYFGETGTEPGQFLMPRNLFIDADQHIYVADPYNNRVQIFQYFAQP